MLDDLGSTDCSGSGGNQGSWQVPGAFHRYHNVRYFKAGAQGEIYLAEDTRHEFGTVAIKVPSKADEQAVNSFLEEASVAASMDHPNVVKVLDSGRINEQVPFLVMKFFARGALADLLARDPKRRWREAVKIARQIASAAQYVCEKRGLVHCDIKPQNILLDEEGRPCLADFGIVSANAGQPLGAVKGTWQYMSPEQASGGNVDARSDVWSIGVILYQMLCGRLPFQSDKLLSQIAMEEPVPPRQIDGQIPAALEHVVFKCLKKLAADRYSSPIELAEALSAIETAWWRKSQLAAAVMFLSLGGGILAWSQSSGRNSAPSSFDVAAPPGKPLPAAFRDIPATGVLLEALTGAPAGTVDSAKRPELEFSIIARRKGRKQGVLNDGDALASQTDFYFLVARPVSEGYLYIFQVDSLGKQTWLFPKNKTSPFSTGENPVRAEQDIQAPADMELFLDDNTGIERVFVVFSSAPWPKLESALLEHAADAAATPPALTGEFDSLSRGVGGAVRRDRQIKRVDAGVPVEVSISTDAVKAKGAFFVLERWFRHVDPP